MTKFLAGDDIETTETIMFDDDMEMQAAIKAKRERVIDKRLEFLYQRREAARKAYMEPDWDDPKERHRTREEYHTAIEAYVISSRRYGREAPSARERCKRYEPT